MQFNHQVSALELMTTATCLSLAEAIMTGDQGGDEDESEGEADGAERTVSEPPPARRVPSAFASTPDDHFRNDADTTTNTPATAAPPVR